MTSTTRSETQGWLAVIETSSDEIESGCAIGTEKATSLGAPQVLPKASGIAPSEAGLAA